VQVLFDITDLILQRQSDRLQLYADFINPKDVVQSRRAGFAKTFVSAVGCYAVDQSGTRYLDCDAGSGVFLLGRNHPTIARTIRSIVQADLPNLLRRSPSLLVGLLAEALVKMAPDGLTKVIFANSGSEAVDIALKLARLVTKRPRFLSFHGEYHGATLGALSVSDYDSEKRTTSAAGLAPLIPGCVRIPPDNIELLAAELAREDVAAIIFEPIRSSTAEPLGYEYARAAAELCRRHGTLLIADEIFVGLGRTGKRFACEHLSLTPDILLIAKALSGGAIPVGAVIVRDDLHSAAHNRPGSHVHESTYAGNDLAMGVGLASLHILDCEGLIERSVVSGQLLLEGLRDLRQKHDMIAAVRGYGLLIGIELKAPLHWQKYPAHRLLERRGLLGYLLMMQLMSRHKTIVTPGRHKNMVRLHPALLFGEAEVALLINAIDAALDDIARSAMQGAKTIMSHLSRMMISSPAE
jgi:ornithine--oxo-acid transaminase